MDFDYSTETITPDNSGTLTIDGHIDLMGHWSPSTGSIAAAGSTQGTATPITTTIVEVSAATSGLGVILPVGPNITTGTNIYVVNTSIYAVNVYPPITGSINGLTKNLPVVVSAGSGMLLSITNMDGDFTSPAWITHTTSLVAGNNISLTHERGKITINGSAGGATLAIEAKDEGVTLTSDLTSINFTGAGVTATNTGGDVTVDIPGGSSQSTVVRVNQTAHGFTKGKVVGCASLSPNWVLVSAGSEQYYTEGIVTKVISANSFEVTTSGVIQPDVLTAMGIDPGSYAPSHRPIFYVDRDNITGNVIERTYATDWLLLAICNGEKPFLELTWDGIGRLHPVGPDQSKYSVGTSTGSTETEIRLWYFSQADDFSYVKAIATSHDTIATHVTALTGVNTDGTGLVVPLHGLSEQPDGIFAWAADGSPINVQFVGVGDYQKVYLSDTVPGGVTLTPPLAPSVCQVVGWTYNQQVIWCPPYVEENDLDYHFVAVQPNHGFTKGTVVFFFEGTWYRVLGFLQEHITPGIVTAVINSNMFRVQTADVISADDLPAGLVGRTRYYPSTTGALVAENAITSTARLDVATGKLPPVLVTFADDYTGGRGIVNPPLSYNPPRNKFVAMYEPTRSLTALLWYRDHTNNNYALASASSISTLATHISVLPPDATDEVALGVSLYDIPAEVEYMFSLGISNQLEDLILAGSEGAKVYLSTVPGQVTLTPPAIRQVVGVLNADGKVLWHVPYREVPNITVSTTAPSSPAIGDVWVDIS